MAVVKMKNFIGSIIGGALSLIKGLLVTIKYIFLPTTTLQYPKQRMPMTERFRGLVDLRREKCIICMQCVKICPTSCLAIGYKQSEDKKKQLESFSYNMELCCFCGLCEQVCPTSAVYMNKLYEIAVYGHEKLHIDLLKQDKYNEWNSLIVR